MFEKFGELNSFGEINELAENLFNEGDTESLKAMAKENGIQNEFIQMYLQGDIPVLCDPLTAAMGKIDVEVAELKPRRSWRTGWNISEASAWKTRSWRTRSEKKERA